MTRTLAVTTLLLASVGMSTAGEDGLNKDWIAKDRDVIVRLAAVLPPGDGSAKAWIVALKPPASKADAKTTDDEVTFIENEDRDVGGGARRILLVLSGGYFGASVSALTREDRVVEVDVRCLTTEADSKAAAAASKDAWGKVPVVTDEEGVRYAWFDDVRRKAHRAALAKELGPRGGPTVPDALRKDFDLLDGVFSDLTYGKSCSEDGGPPPGRAAIESLVKARAIGPLRALVRSPNPEGRLYALEGLERLAKGGEALTDADRATIATIKASPVPIHDCAGCLVSTDTAAEALRKQREEDESAQGDDKRK